MEQTQHSVVQPQLLWTVSGWVEAPLEAAFQALLRVQQIERAGGQLILLANSIRTPFTEIAPQRFTASVGERGAGRIRYEVDLAQHTMSMQGEFWYRGVYTARSLQHDQATQIEYSTYNLAPGLWRWIVPIWQRDQKAQMQPTLMKTLKAIGAHLNCTVYTDERR